MVDLLAKGCSLCQQLTAKLLAKRTASVPFGRAGASPTAFLNPFANSRTLPSVLGFWAVGEDFFPDSRVFLLGKIFFANSSGLGYWESSGLLAKPQFPVVSGRFRFCL
jgi:hypothetical protein